MESQLLPSQAQRLLSETKWGEEVTILAMPPQETVIFYYSETTNAGVIVMKVMCGHMIGIMCLESYLMVGVTHNEAIDILGHNYA